MITDNLELPLKLGHSTSIRFSFDPHGGCSFDPTWMVQCLEIYGMELRYFGFSHPPLSFILKRNNKF